MPWIEETKIKDIIDVLSEHRCTIDNILYDRHPNCKQKIEEIDGLITHLWTLYYKEDEQCEKT